MNSIRLDTYSGFGVCVKGYWTIHGKNGNGKKGNWKKATDNTTTEDWATVAIITFYLLDFSSCPGNVLSRNRPVGESSCPGSVLSLRRLVRETSGYLFKTQYGVAVSKSHV